MEQSAGTVRMPVVDAHGLKSLSLLRDGQQLTDLLCTQEIMTTCDNSKSHMWYMSVLSSFVVSVKLSNMTNILLQFEKFFDGFFEGVKGGVKDMFDTCLTAESLENQRLSNVSNVSNVFLTSFINFIVFTNMRVKNKIYIEIDVLRLTHLTEVAESLDLQGFEGVNSSQSMFDTLLTHC